MPPSTSILNAENAFCTSSAYWGIIQMQLHRNRGFSIISRNLILSTLGILSVSRKAQIYVQKHVSIPTNGFEVKGCLRPKFGPESCFCQKVWKDCWGKAPSLKRGRTVSFRECIIHWSKMSGEFMFLHVFGWIVIFEDNIWQISLTQKWRLYNPDMF